MSEPSFVKIQGCQYQLDAINKAKEDLREAVKLRDKLMGQQWGLSGYEELKLPTDVYTDERDTAQAMVNVRAKTLIDVLDVYTAMWEEVA